MHDGSGAMCSVMIVVEGAPLRACREQSEAPPPTEAVLDTVARARVMSGAQVA